MAELLPSHLKKYIVEQHYEKYTPVDQACWRYILRQLKNFLSKHAHESYVEGLEKTGIEIERIPHIHDISQKLSTFGWRALPVSGFIPPAAFMEMQSLGVLPIASAMRTLDHLTYTPAPDIVHEAAGHAPILIHPEFAQYLKEYAQIARKAIVSKEDLDLYEAIRELSDIKENPDSTLQEIAAAQKNLDEASRRITHISEAAELGRMNWWTAEYGLIGDLKNPKIFGAGLLSSVGESKFCLSDKVKKIPLTEDCIQTSYDITEPQPQLFVTPDFKNLTRVLHAMAEKMAFKKGGLEGVKKAIQAESVNTIELDSGVQISGKCIDAITGGDHKTIIYLRFQDPVQICYKDQELQGHGKSHHASGFGTALGRLQSASWTHVLEQVGQHVHLEFHSGIKLDGVVKGNLEKDGKLLIVSFEKCSVKYKDQVLFEPPWGTYDLAIGQTVTSVFGGPADREKYGDTDDFVAARVPEKTMTPMEHTLYQNYQMVRDLREKHVKGPKLEQELEALIEKHKSQFPSDWLLLLETYELLCNRHQESLFKEEVLLDLKKLSQTHPEKRDVIEDGLSLALQL
ncbi:MAG: aromatic amino acid hydroxylase [Pseudobdellovibrionaceae bacterium]